MPLKSELISLEANRLLSLYYRESLEALARLAYKTKQAGILDLSKPIRWSDFPPERRREAEGILTSLHARLSNLYQKGTQSAWLSGEKQAIQQNRTLHMTPKARAKVNASNRHLIKDLQTRKVGGLSVSSRVWGLIEDAEGKLELSLQSVLNDPKASRDPKALSRAFLRKLQNPDEVMRSLREGNQHETLQRAKQLFGRGVGIYRDPLKNIERLFRTEITKANREAQWQMFQQNPYITGFRIKRSGRLVDGKPLPCPLCDSLQGVYPKSFRFSVWHPHCECIMEPIFGSTKDPEFVAKVNQSASRGVDAVRKLENPEAIEELPKGMLDFASRIQRSRSGGALLTPAGKVPALFIQENAHLLRPHFATPSKTNGKPSAQSPAPQPTPPTALERSRLRQTNRTPDQIAEIQKRWDERNAIRKTEEEVKQQYPLSQWQHTYISPAGGYLVTDLERIKKGRMNSSERGIFNKEQEISRVGANNGYKILHLSDKDRPAGQTYDVLLDGVPAELKSFSGAGAVERQIKDAIRKQGAELVLVRIEEGSDNERIIKKLIDVKQKIKGRILYYFENQEDEVHEIH